MIFITGDIHGDPRRFNTESFPEQYEMTKNDYVIICGDFGLVWDYRGQNKNEKYWLDWLENKPFTTLFVDGNHENHERLNAYTVEEWHGGNVHKIRPSVIHLMRGQVFNIDDKKVFTFGGARSHDIKDGVLEPDDPKIKEWQNDLFRLFRINKRSWWKEELPIDSELECGRTNLKINNNSVDYIISHSPSTRELYALGEKGPDILTDYLDEICLSIDYKYHFFGHMHINQKITDKDICLFEQIIRIH